MSFQRLSVLGFGLLGASVARAAEKFIPDVKISVYDRKPGAIEPFLSQKIASFTSAAAATQAAECVVVAVPPDQVGPILAEIGPSLTFDAIVTDVVSVKRSVIAAAEAMLPRPSRFVGGHPMAGGERSGSSASRADLFQGATVVLTPTENTSPDAVTAIEKFWMQLGAHTRRMTPLEHDQAVAAISHVPHALASTLMHLMLQNSAELVGPGFRDMTRIARGDPDLWCQILVSNADEVREVLTSVKAQLGQLEQMLETPAVEALRNWLASAAEARRQLDGAAGPTSGQKSG